MNSKISDKDKKDWENFLSENETLPNKDNNLTKDFNKHIYTFDLHGFSLDEANRKIKELIFFLNSQNKIIQINDSLIIDNNAFNNLLSSVREHFINCKTLSISDFKNISRLTRKSAIPILEYFDSRRFTKREGSNRVAGEKLFVK